MDLPLKRDIYYSAFFNSTGFSQAAQDYIMSLFKGGYNIKIDPFVSIIKQGMSQDRFSFFQKLEKNNISNNAIHIYHCIPNLQIRKSTHRYKKNVAITTYETFDPPKIWIDILNKNDLVIVPSEFNRDTFLRSGLKSPIYHIPHCIDTDIYNDNRQLSANDNNFKFLFFGSWKERKGYAQLIEAWLKEFDRHDGVTLTIKTDKTAKASVYINNILSDMKYKKKDIAPILLESNIYDENGLPEFLKKFDCLVVPTMGEGFLLPGIQCMAVKVPVLITNCSGCQEYAKNNLATLFEPTGYILKESMDNYPQFSRKKWAYLTIDEIRKKMRYVVENKNVVDAKAEIAYKFVRENFSYKVILEKLNNILESV